MKDLSSRTLDEITLARSASKKATLVTEVDQRINHYLTDAYLTTKMLTDELGFSVCRELISSDEPIEPMIQKYGFILLEYILRRVQEEIWRHFGALREVEQARTRIRAHTSLLIPANRPDYRQNLHIHGLNVDMEVL
ncbi:hypothetical protein [Paenibacillus sp. NPDC057934]|uniref:hypothetical protein n=1 Tax=Paenibacillus sp. NPDC057934 TaxID=3346282 RepID=UPI0036DD20F2